MTRVLVTGGSGFIGRAAVPALRSRGFDIVELSRDRTDLLDVAATAGAVRDIAATHLLHLAWYVEHGDYWTSPVNAQWVDASEQLFRTFVDAGGRRIVSVGTCAEYDWSNGVCVEDETPIAPVTIYGAAKAELHRRLRSLDVSYAWARLFFIYGPHEDARRFIPSSTLAALHGGGVICRNPEIRRDFLYVDDAGAALAALVEANAEGAVNVGSGRAVALSDVASMIGGTNVRIDRGAQSEAALVVADTTRLARIFTPAIDLAEGLRRTKEWWRAHE